MQISGLINALPLWLFFPATWVLVLIVWEIGFRLGRKKRRRLEGETEHSVSSIVGVILGLVAFLLAFTFNMAAGRFQERRDSLVEDVNAIGTAYLRTEVVAEPERSNLRRLMRDYVDNRLELAPGPELAAKLERAESLQTNIWAEMVRAAEKERSPMTFALMGSINEMIDIHAKRVTIAFYHRIPDSVWVSLYLLTLLGIGSMGYQNGYLDKERSATMLVVTLMFSLVIAIIADLDRPGEGTITVDQQSMIHLRNSMNE